MPRKYSRLCFPWVRSQSSEITMKKKNLSFPFALMEFVALIAHTKPLSHFKKYLALFLACMVLPAIVDAAPAKSGKKNPPKPVADSTAVKVNGFSYSIEPEPSWIVVPKPEAGAALPHAALRYDLLDEQVRVEAENASTYSHVVRVVNDAAGLGTAAQTQIDFDPSFQALAIHKVRVVRGGESVSRLNKSSVKLLQREAALESRIYNGQVTASIVLDDIRVGDKIEYSYTIRGTNPVFNGKFMHLSAVGSWRGPVALYQFRLLAPENRKIQYRAEPDLNISSRLIGNERETLFRRTSIPQIQPDANVPGGYYISYMIQFSEFDSWNGVARWGESLFQQTNLASDAIKAQANLIRAKGQAQEKQLQEALDFVQTQIRYFGTEVGPYSYLPVTPGKVMSQRFGDCKGKVGLLIALLTELGIDAAPVMVSNFYQGDVAALIPSGAVFDHVIARVQIGDHIYWLDGTRSHQTGQLSQRQTFGLGKGLVLRATETALADLPGSENEARIQVNDMLTITKFDQDPVMTSETTLYGELAEATRSSLLLQPREQFESEFMAEYIRHYPNIRRTGTLHVEEIPDQNAIKVRNEFTLPKFWNFDSQHRLAGSISNWSVFQALRFPNDPGRSRPYQIRSPGIYRHTTTITYPEDVVRGRDTDKFDDATMFYRFHAEHVIEPRQFRFDTELRIVRDRVNANEWSSYIDKLKTLAPKLDRTVLVSSIPLSQYEGLIADLKAMDEKIRAGDSQVRAPTSVQKDSRLRNIVLTAQLNGGRLGPELRAEILRERGITFDNIGKAEVALEDFKEAIRLAPENVQNYSAAAVNAFQLGDDRRALDMANKALELSAADDSALNVKNYLLYLSGQFAESKKSLVTRLKNSSEVELGYSTLKLYLTARQLGEDGNAAVKPYIPTSQSPRWPYPVLQLMIGSIDLDQAMKLALENPRDPSRLCELYFYLGEKYLLDGDRRRAKEYFVKSVGTGVVEFNEYNLSMRRIKYLTGEVGH